MPGAPLALSLLLVSLPCAAARRASNGRLLPHFPPAGGLHLASAAHAAQPMVQPAALVVGDPVKPVVSDARPPSSLERGAMDFAASTADADGADMPLYDTPGFLPRWLAEGLHRHEHALHHHGGPAHVRDGSVAEVGEVLITRRELADMQHQLLSAEQQLASVKSQLEVALGKTAVVEGTTLVSAPAESLDSTRLAATRALGIDSVDKLVAAKEVKADRPTPKNLERINKEAEESLDNAMLPVDNFFYFGN